MRHLAALAILIAATTGCHAGEGFDRVIPGRPGVPIVINGLDVSYAVVEGDFGLARGYQSAADDLWRPARRARAAGRPLLSEPRP